MLGVPAPLLIARGFIDDKYHFDYLITEYINGVEFSKAFKKMSISEKISIGQKLREITDRMNIKCEPFNNIDVVNDKNRWTRWDKYPDSFKAEREEYIKIRDYSDKVFVHGDIFGDNIILTKDGGIYIIDFADAVLAPIFYEHTLIAADNLDRAFLNGYFGDYSVNELAELCFDGLLIHDFGGDIVAEHMGKPYEFKNLDDLRKRLRQKIGF